MSRISIGTSQEPILAALFPPMTLLVPLCSWDIVDSEGTRSIYQIRGEGARARRKDQFGQVLVEHPTIDDSSV